jgi:membrane protein implicated in regulation of membrane protease activity
MEPWIYWLVGSIILALLELILSGFVLLCFGFAALLATLISLLKVGLEVQVFSFIAFTVLSLVIIRPFFLKHMKPRGGLVETNVYALIGKEALVTEEMSDDHSGRVKVGGEEWRAITNDNISIPVGSRVRILSVSGNKLLVQL